MKINITSAKAIAVTLLLIGLVGIGCQSQTDTKGNSLGLSNASPTADETPEQAVSLLEKNWNSAPIPFYISNTVPEAFVQPILDSFLMWEESVGAALFEYKGKSDSENRQFDGKNVVYWTDEPSPNGYLGETFFKIKNKTIITESDIVFYGNPEKFAALTCEDSKTVCKSNEGKFDVTTTALHEIGHFLGLEHTTEKGAIMNPNFGMNSVVHNLEGGFISELQSTYAPALAQGE